MVGYHSNINNKDCLYLFGGSNEENLCDNNLYYFEDNKWEVIEIADDIRPPCRKYGVGVINSEKYDYIAIYGGISPETQNYLGDIWKYNILSKIWRKVDTVVYLNIFIGSCIK